MELMDVIRTRRTIRQFQSRPIPRAELEAVLEAACWAPSGFNRQNWRFIVLAGEEKRRLLAEARIGFIERLGEARPRLAPSMAALTQAFFEYAEPAPVIIAIYSDVPLSRDVEAGLSVAAAIQNLLLAAHERGLGACWNTRGLYVADAINRFLNVPEDWDLIALIPLGYPAESPEPLPRLGERVFWRGLPPA